MADQPPHMWSYWRDQKGLRLALEDYYPETLTNNPLINLALLQIKHLSTTIDLEMLRLEAKNDDE